MILKKRKRKVKFVGRIIEILAGFIVFFLLTGYIHYQIESEKQIERLNITKAFSVFQQETNKDFSENFVLLKGFQAFIETYEGDDFDNDAKRYMSKLLSDHIGYIKYVAILKDTTVSWGYPQEVTESALGVDIMDYTVQATAIKQVKEERVSILVGPVELMDGDQGFIGRMPIILEDGSYYGQLAMAYYSEPVIAFIKKEAAIQGIKVHIVDQRSGYTIVEDPDVLDMEPLKLVISEPYCKWDVYLAPSQGWKVNYTKIFLLEILALFISIMVTLGLKYGFRLNADLKDIASKDRLTGLYNRHFLDEYRGIILSQADRYRKNVGFILIDLAKFKDINDGFGHAMGDQVLVKTAEILLALTRSDEAAFRLGGDEFLVLLPDLMEEKDVYIVEKRLKDAFKQPFEINEQEIYVEPTIGVGVYPRDGSDFEEVMHSTDIKMYKNKDTSKRKE